MSKFALRSPVKISFVISVLKSSSVEYSISFHTDTGQLGAGKRYHISICYP